MESSTHNPGTGATAAHRQELYAELRKRNERRARVARLTESPRERALKRAMQVERVMQMQRAHRPAKRG
jgi:hypothetical protein